MVIVATFRLGCLYGNKDDKEEIRTGIGNDREVERSETENVRTSEEKDGERRINDNMECGSERPKCQTRVEKM